MILHCELTITVRDLAAVHRHGTVVDYRIVVIDCDLVVSDRPFVTTNR